MSNYIQVVGEVAEIYDDPKYGITFALSNMNTKLDDICFRIRGKNADIVRKNDYENKIAVGDTITIMTCPRYFYDGYEYPVVALSVMMWICCCLMMVSLIGMSFMSKTEKGNYWCLCRL